MRVLLLNEIRCFCSWKTRYPVILSLQVSLSIYPSLSSNNQSTTSAKMTEEKQNPSTAENSKKPRKSRRRKQKKNKKASQPEEENSETLEVTEEVEVEYIPEKAELDEVFDKEFREIFEKFSFKKPDVPEETAPVVTSSNKKADSDSEAEESNSKQEEEKTVSNKQKKLQRRMKIGELKQICSRPDVVEAWDVTASDPKLLVYLKSYRNTVPVPRHWSQKRSYLQGKRGIEKPPFQLPDFIADTGIEKLRQAYIEKESSKKLKQKQKDKTQPKMGKLDIDYQVLHDAFFKYQTKPMLSSHGEVYYEGKEFEVKIRTVKPGGVLSPALKEALGMIEGAPPPWLGYMQKYGPPPSYPHLKIPGLNFPIPHGARFGDLNQGGWGMPPVDRNGMPLYGDVFRVQPPNQPYYDEEPVDKTKLWGDLEEEEEVEVEEEEEVEEVMKQDEMEDGVQSVDSCLSGTATGVETPDIIDLRKQHKKETEKVLYQVLEEKEERIGPGTFLAPSHTYVIASGAQDKNAAKRVDLRKSQKADGVEVTLQPEEIEVMDDVLASKYEEAREEEKRQSLKEDFREMVVENEKKRKRKMQDKDGKSKKKEFKF